MDIRVYTTYNEKEILKLYDSVGWTAYTDAPEKLRLGFENSLSVLASYDNDKLTGIVRVVGDGHTIVYVQDILVLPEYQRKGIGSTLIKAILDKYPDVRQILLATDNTPESIAFYKNVGFCELSQYGCCAFMKINS